MSYNDYYSKMQQLSPRIAIMSEKHWRDEGSPTADQWMMLCRGLDWATAMKYPHDTGQSLAQKQAEKEAQKAEQPAKPRGRPKGSKNKPKRPKRG